MFLRDGSRCAEYQIPTATGAATSNAMMAAAVRRRGRSILRLDLDRGSIIRAHDRRDESIAESRHGFDKGGVIGRISERMSHLAHQRIEASVEIDDDLAWPQSRDHFFARDQQPVAGNQQDQQIEGATLEPDRFAAQAQHVGAKV